MSDTATHTDTLRAADLPTLAAALNDQRTRSIDVVIPAKKLSTVLGAVRVDGCEPVVDDDGVTNVDGFYTPTSVGDEGIAAKLGIPIGYLRKCRTEDVDLYDANVNGWLKRGNESYLLRLLTHHDGPQDDGSAGIVRAFLSDRYRCIDNFDVLLASLKGMRVAGVTDPIIRADLTDRRMIVRVQAPQISALAPKLLENYRNPWTGKQLGNGWTPDRMAEHNARLDQLGHHNPADPVVFAGFVITNSETGNGKFSITPEITMRICNNGMTITAEALSKVHIGGGLEDGVIEWSDETIHRNLALVESQTADAVGKFLSVDYVEAKIVEAEKLAGVEIDDAPAVIETVSKRLGFTQGQQADILSMFVRGGQLTAGGVMQAVTATAQTIGDGDDAWDMQCKGVAAMHEAVAAVRSLARV